MISTPKNSELADMEVGFQTPELVPIHSARGDCRYAVL